MTATDLKDGCLELLEERDKQIDDLRSQLDRQRAQMADLRTRLTIAADTVEASLPYRFGVLQAQHAECLRTIARLEARVVELTPYKAAFDAASDELGNATKGEKTCCLQCLQVRRAEEYPDETGVCRECK